MIIDKKIVYARKKEEFEPLIPTIPEGLNPVVFIEDTREMWTCGTYFSIGYPSIEVSEVSGSVKVQIGNSFFLLTPTGDSISLRKGDGNRIIISSNALNRVDTEPPLKWDASNRKLLHMESGVASGSYGQSTNLGNASVFVVPNFIVDATGHITFAENHNVEIRDYVEQVAPSNQMAERNILLSYNEANNNMDTSQVRKANGLTFNDATQRITVAGGMVSDGAVTVNHGDVSVLDGYIIGKLKGDVEGQATPKIHLSLKPEYGGASTKLYGHVKLQDILSRKPDPSSDNENINDTNVVAAIAASPLMVWNAIETAKSYADSILGSNNAMLFKGALEAGISSPGTYTPMADVGNTYVVTFGNGAYRDSVGYINGVSVEVGDLLICKEATAASDGTNWEEVSKKWTYVQTNTTGVVSGPSSATIGQLAVFDSITGKLIKGLPNGSVGQMLVIGESGIPAWANKPDRLNYALSFQVKGVEFTSFDGYEAKKVNFIAGDNMFITSDNQGNLTLAADPGSDTVNTAGATNKVDTKLFLIGAESQTTAPQTYSNQYVYIGTDNCLYSLGKKVLTEHQAIYNLDLQTQVGEAVTKVTTFDPNAANNSFTLVQGTNVTLTPDAANKKVTISSKDTTYDFYNLVFKQGESVIDTYKPTTSPSKTLKAGTNVTFTGSNNEVLITTQDTRNTAGATEKLTTKLFLTGALTQTDNPQTYTNSKVYIGADNKLYSDGKVVSTGDHTHNYAGATSPGGPALKVDLNPSGLLDATYGSYGGILQDSNKGPVSGSWSNRIKILHNNSTGYYTELAQNFTGTAGLWHRRNVAGTVSEWTPVIDNANFHTYLDSTYVIRGNDPNVLTNYVRYSIASGLTMNWEWGNATPTHIWGAKASDSSKAYVFNGDNIRAFANAVNKAGDTMTGNLKMTETTNIILRFANTGYTSGIGYDTSGNECIALWAKNTITRLRWYAGKDMSNMVAGSMMGITPDFEVSKASGSAVGYIGGSTIWHSGNSNLTSVAWNAKEITFGSTNFPKDGAPRANISPYSIKVWDSYGQVVAGSSNYGVVLEVMGRGGHWDNQLYFEAYGHNIWHRASSYNDSSWSYTWEKLAVQSDLSKYLLLSGGTMSSGARISHNGHLYIGHPSNSGWVGVQDICSQSSLGDEYWSIRINGTAVFKGVTGSGFTKTGSSDNYVLLGGGGHRALSDLGRTHTHSQYVAKTGDTMTGALKVMNILLQNNDEINCETNTLFLQYRGSKGICLCNNNQPLTYGSSNYTIYHTGNLSLDNYVKKTGDTMTGNLQVGQVVIGNTNEVNATDNGIVLYLGYRNTPGGVNICYNNAPLTYGSAKYTIYHSGNISSVLNKRRVPGEVVDFYVYQVNGYTCTSTDYTTFRNQLFDSSGRGKSSVSYKATSRSMTYTVNLSDFVLACNGISAYSNGMYTAGAGETEANRVGQSVGANSKTISGLEMPKHAHWFSHGRSDNANDRDVFLPNAAEAWSLNGTTAAGQGGNWRTGYSGSGQSKDWRPRTLLVFKMVYAPQSW